MFEERELFVLEQHESMVVQYAPAETEFVVAKHIQMQQSQCQRMSCNVRPVCLIQLCNDEVVTLFDKIARVDPKAYNQFKSIWNYFLQLNFT